MFVPLQSIYAIRAMTGNQIGNLCRLCFPTVGNLWTMWRLKINIHPIECQYLSSCTNYAKDLIKLIYLGLQQSIKHKIFWSCFVPTPKHNQVMLTWQSLFVKIEIKSGERRQWESVPNTYIPNWFGLSNRVSASDCNEISAQKPSLESL